MRPPNLKRKYENMVNIGDDPEAPSSQMLYADEVGYQTRPRSEISVQEQMRPRSQQEQEALRRYIEMIRKFNNEFSQD